MKSNLEEWQAKIEEFLKEERPFVPLQKVKKSDQQINVDKGSGTFQTNHTTR